MTTWPDHLNVADAKSNSISRCDAYGGCISAIEREPTDNDTRIEGKWRRVTVYERQRICIDDVSDSLTIANESLRAFAEKNRWV